MIIKPEEKSYTMCEVEAAMCVWEHVLLNKTVGLHPSGYWPDKLEELGYAEVRSECIALADKVETSYTRLAAKYDFCDAYDWNFVPGVVDELEDPLAATLGEVLTAAETFLMEEKAAWEARTKEANND